MSFISSFSSEFLKTRHWITCRKTLLASVVLIQSGATSHLKTKAIMVIPALLRQYFKGVGKRCAITHACCCRHPSLYRCDQQHHSSKEQERHKGRSIMKRIFEIRDFILHLATGPCWDLSCYEIMFILHCSLSQPSISSLCFHHQEYSVPVTLDTPTTTTTTHLSWGAHPCSTGPALCLLTGAGWLKHLWHPCSLWAALLTV